MTLDHDIPNLALVSKETALYRCGQRRDKAAWNYARSLFPPKSNPLVIKLNTEPGDELSGMTVLSFPITTVQQIWGPVKAQFEAALAAITDNTIIHCQLGENRTGTLIILYRMRVCGWTKAMAVAEAKKFEWEWSLPALQVFVEEL